MAVSDQVAIIWAGVKGYLDDIAVNQISAFEKGFLEFLSTRYTKAMKALAKEKILTPEIESQLESAVSAFKKTFSPKQK